MLRFLTRTALIAAWLGVTSAATLTEITWLWVTVFVGTGLLAGWATASWWAALAPLAVGLGLAVFAAPSAHGYEMTPDIAVGLIFVFIVPALEIVLLAGVGARKIWRAI